MSIPVFFVNSSDFLGDNNPILNLFNSVNAENQLEVAIPPNHSSQFSSDILVTPQINVNNSDSDPFNMMPINICEQLEFPFESLQQSTNANSDSDSFNMMPIHICEQSSEFPLESLQQPTTTYPINPNQKTAEILPNGSGQSNAAALFNLERETEIPSTSSFNFDQAEAMPIELGINSSRQDEINKIFATLLSDELEEIEESAETSVKK